MTSNGDPPQFDRVLELAMTAPCTDQNPAIFLESFQDVSDLHQKRI